MINNVDKLSYVLLRKTLDAASERQRAISNNIANLNTPGYKANRVIFEEKIKNILDNRSITLNVTNEKHINNNSLQNISYSVIKDKSKSMRLDGNNVDVDLEMANLAANQILYNALVNQANTKISMRRSVINSK